jgi:hypothetical protein
VGTTWNHPTQLKYVGQLDNVIHPSGVQIENELQICLPVEVKSINDLNVKSVALETKWSTPFLNHVKGSHVQSQSEDSKNVQAEQICCNT